MLKRFSMAIDTPLFARLERMVRARGYANRSEFIRDLLREKLVEDEWSADAEVIGTVTLVYDHETRELSKKLHHLQHAHHGLVLATTHVHLDAHLCAEMILMRGRAGALQAMADLLRQQKGVLHAALTTSSTGTNLA